MKAAHLRVGKPVLMHAVLGLLVWGGFCCANPDCARSFRCDVGLPKDTIQLPSP
jgi:hypothetical protein